MILYVYRKKLICSLMSDSGILLGIEKGEKNTLQLNICKYFINRGGFKIYVFEY